MSSRINPNLEHLYKSFTAGKTGVILEGSSRSGKTWSSVDFIVYLCSRVSTDWTINIIKDTYNSFKTTLYDDFNRRLPMFGIQSPFSDRQEVSQFRLFGNKINLLGAEDESKFHGASCDVFYGNEMLDVSQQVFDQSEQRCRKFFWGDYNPKAASHWVYDKVCLRPDVAFLKTTFKDNPFISPTERRKIEGYEPTPQNIANGTADDYMWNVYGLGLRSAPEGLIFQHVTWVKEFPKNIEQIYYGLDFGYTNSPSVLSKIGIIGSDLYAQKLFYTPTPSVVELELLMRQFIHKDGDKDEHGVALHPETVWADPSGDSGGRGMISQLRRMGYRVLATNTFPGSIKYGISVLKKFKLHLVDDADVRKEQGNYKFREINGIKLDMPIDDFNHFWDSIRMPAMSNLHR